MRTSIKIERRASRRRAQSANINGILKTFIHSSCASRYWVAGMIQVRLCPVALVLMIAGCADPMPVQQTNVSPPSITSFDGSYRNTIRVTGTAGEAKGTNWCETPGQPIITVSSGRFSYAIPHPNVPGNPTPTFQAVMSQDGSFSGQANNGTIAGKVSGSRLQGTIDGEGCIYAFTGDRM